MEKFDVMVIGAGSGEIIVDYALSHGMKVALIEKGPLGGTCLNSGCVFRVQALIVAAFQANFCYIPPTSWTSLKMLKNLV